jgi:hypothetical protein
MNLESKAVVPEYVLARQVADETVILDLESGNYYGLDHVGVRIWQLLGADNTLHQVCDAIIKEFDVQRADVERDLVALVQALVEAKLLTLVDN